MSSEESPSPPEQSSVPVTNSVSRSVADFAKRNSFLTDLSRSTLEFRSANSRVWVPDTSGKYVLHRSHTGLSDDENNRLSKTSLDYDPYKNRVFKSSIGNCVALLHLLKGCIGNGVWEMPSGFRIAGLLTGTIATVIMAALLSYSFNLLMRTQYLLCKRKRIAYLSYGESMKYALEEGPDWMIRFSKESKTLTNIVMFLYQFGILCVYMNSISKAVKGVVDDFHCDVLSLQAMISALAILFFLIICVPNLQKFGYFTAVAMTLTMICLSMVSYQVFTEVRVQEKRPSLIGTPKEWNKFVDIMMFAMFSVGTMCTAERHMKHPKDFVGFFGVNNISVMLMAILYWFFGFSGYYIYGVETKSNIIDNLPLNEGFTRAVFIMQAIALLISFGLQAIPAVDILWNEYLLPRMTYTSTTRQNIYNYTLRAVIFISVYGITMSIGKYFGTIVSLIVVVNVALLGFGFPATIEICYLWPNNFGKLNWIYYKDLAMCVLSVAIMACGFYNAIDAALSPHSPPVFCTSTSKAANDTN